MPRKKAVAIVINQKKISRKSSGRSKPNTRRESGNVTDRPEPASEIPGTANKYYYALFALTAIISLGLLTFSFFVARENHRSQQAAFNSANIKLDATAPLVANFIETGQEQEFTFSFNLTNNAEYAYNINFNGTVTGNPSILKDSQELSLKPGSTLPLEVKVPLSYVKAETISEGGPKIQTASLNLKLSSKVAANSILGALITDIEKQFPIEIKLASDKEIVGAEIVPTETALTQSSTSTPTLNMTLILQNKTSRAFSSGLYEVNLVTTDRKLVQPLVADQYVLTPNETINKPLSFKFDLPPANQIDPGSQNYYLEVRYTGRTGTRNVAITSYSNQQIKINVAD